MIRKLSTIFLTLAIFIFAFPPVANAADTVREIIFPILNGVTYTDDFGVPRVGGRTHEGNDLMAPKMRPLVAVVDGIVSFITTNEETWGYSLTIVDEDGYKYNYLHMNNDTPGTDDGKGGYKNAFAQDIELGSKVIAGQLIGYVGDSGNAETIAPHLHFEIRTDSDRAINPYPSLQASKVISKAVTNENPEIVEVETLEPSKEPLDKPTVNTPEEIIPYDLFEGGANISSGNIDKDTDPEFVVGTAFAGGGRTIIKEFDSDGDLLKEFFAYGDVFRGGVDVASADMDGDGLSEIITAPGPGGGPHIKVFDPDGKVVSEFMAYSSAFHGGVRVAASDIDGDGKAEIITAPGPGGGPHIKVFDAKGKVKSETMAYSPGFTGGVDVAAFAPKDGISGGFATAPGPGGGPHVKVFKPDLKIASEFMAYPASFSGGVRISAGNVIEKNGAFEIVTGPASNSSANTKIFKTTGDLLKNSFTGFEKIWAGGTDVAIVGTETFLASSGGRQTSIRKAEF